MAICAFPLVDWVVVPRNTKASQDEVVLFVMFWSSLEVVTVSVGVYSACMIKGLVKDRQVEYVEWSKSQQNMCSDLCHL